MDQSANGLIGAKMQRAYDSESTIFSLERAGIDKHIKKIEMKYKDLNVARKKAILEMRRGGQRVKIESTELKASSRENDAAIEHRKTSTAKTNANFIFQRFGVRRRS